MKNLVEPRGVEPPTSALRTQRSPNWATAPYRFGGRPRVARQQAEIWGRAIRLSSNAHRAKALSCLRQSVQLGCDNYFLKLPADTWAMQHSNPFLWLILTIIDLYIWALFISVILSWLVAFNVVNTHNQFVNTVGNFMYRVTEPLLGPIRRMLPNFGGLDISPLVLILLLVFAQKLLISYWPIWGLVALKTSNVCAASLVRFKAKNISQAHH